MKPVYGPDDLDGPRLPRHLSGHRALSARPLPDHVCHAAVDRAAVCRLLDRRGFQRLLSPQPRGRAEGPLGRVRSRDPSRLRLGSPARFRRRRHGRRRDRLDLRHAHAVLRHPARPDERVDDHERRGAAGARALHRGGGGTGRAAGKALRHDPERHPERIHGAQHLHLPAHALDAHHLGHLRLRLRAHAEIQLDLDLRLSHAGGGRDAGPRARLHARRRRRICARRPEGRARHRPLRAAALVLLGDRHELLHGGREAARRAPDLGEADEAGRREGSALALAAHAFADLRLVAHRAGRLQQRGAHRDRGDGGDAGPHPVAAHQCARRGAGAAVGFLRPHRAQHAAVPAAGERHHAHRRPVGRLVLCRAADRGAGQEGLGPHPGGRRARRHGQGDRGRHSEAAHRGSRRQGAGAHRLAARSRSSA